MTGGGERAEHAEGNALDECVADRSRPGCAGTNRPFGRRGESLSQQAHPSGTAEEHDVVRGLDLGELRDDLSRRA